MEIRFVNWAEEEDEEEEEKEEEKGAERIGSFDLQTCANLICVRIYFILGIIVSYYKSGLQIRFVDGRRRRKRKTRRRR